MRRLLSQILICDDLGTRLRGLMGRRSWPKPYRGLYFPDCRALHTYFTFLKPDLLFLDKDGKILKIIPSAKAWRFFVGPWGCRHCLELESGKAKRSGYRKGDRIQCG